MMCSVFNCALFSVFDCAVVSVFNCAVFSVFNCAIGCVFDCAAGPPFNWAACSVFIPDPLSLLSVPGLQFPPESTDSIVSMQRS